jgi:hypothetical protein
LIFAISLKIPIAEFPNGTANQQKLALRVNPVTLFLFAMEMN